MTSTGQQSINFIKWIFPPKILRPRPVPNLFKKNLCDIESHKESLKKKHKRD